MSMESTKDQDREKMRIFLREKYKHDRFEGRDGHIWGADYSDHIVSCALDDLRLYGQSRVCRHDSVTGEQIIFGREALGE